MHEPPSDSSSKKQHIENSSIQESQVSMAQTEGPVHQATATGSSTIHQTNISINLAPAHTDQESESSLGNTSSPLNEKVPNSPKSSSSGSDIDRDDLLDRLSSCPPGIFRKVVSYMKTPAGTLSSEMSAQATRASELLDWSEHVDGSGIEKLESSYKRATQRKLTPRSNRFRLVSVVIINLLIASSTIGLRSLGMLQPLELAAYDLFMRSRLWISPEKPDNRLLIVEITDEDIEYLKGKDELVLLNSDQIVTDKVILELLKKIESHQPNIVGLDIFRDTPQPTEEDYLELSKYVKNSAHIITVCRAVPPEREIGDEDQPGKQPLKGVDANYLGFADVVFDGYENEVIRRHLLAINIVKNIPCMAEHSFSLQLALRYLESKGINVLPLEDESGLVFESSTKKTTTLRYLPAQTQAGGYSPRHDNNSFAGLQILLNYRASEPIAQTVSLKCILEEQVDDGNCDHKNFDFIKDKVVLIGYAVGDLHQTPYTFGYEKMPGVHVQAHMVSQIISAAQDSRHFISIGSVVSENLNILYIFFWTCLAGKTTLRTYPLQSSRRYQLIRLAVLSVSCIFSSYVFLYLGAWVPLVPSLIGIFANPTGVVLILNNPYFSKLLVRR